MKNNNWAEKIGFILIIVGFVLMVLNDSWENNPIPNITKNNMMIGSLGLLTWALGYMKKQNEQKKKE